MTTFEEMRRKMEEMEAKAKEDAAKAPKEEQPQNQGKEMEVDFDVKNTGQTKTINGFDTRTGDRHGPFGRKGKSSKTAAGW